MKKISLLVIISVILFSCKKEDNFIEYNKNKHDEFCTLVYVYDFKGSLTDTSNGNSLVGYSVHADFSLDMNNQNIDTLSDSTYFIRIATIKTYDSIYNESNNKVYIKNTSNVIVDSFSIPISLWTLGDTATYNYSF